MALQSPAVDAHRRPVRSVVRAEAGYALASMAAALGGYAAAVRLWHAVLGIPLSSSGDVMLAMQAVRNMELSGWYQTTPLLGFPFGQNLAAYSSAAGDLWNMVTLKLLSVALTPAASVNAFYLLSFASVAVCAYVALRVVRVSRASAATLAAVYSLLPYHFLRGEPHLFLSSYCVVPLAAAVALAVYQGRLDLWRHPRRLGAIEWMALGTAILLCGSGLYYAAFALALFAAAGLFASLAQRRWRPILSAGLLSAVVVTGLLLSALPYLTFGPVPGSETVTEGRSYASSEIYGLKLTNLLLPLAHHRIDALALPRGITDAETQLHGENMETLGLLGVIGLVSIVVAVLLPRVKRSPLADGLRPLGALAVVGILLGTVAGLNGILAALGFGSLRAWNRISVVIAFFAIAGLGMVLDAGRARAARWSALHHPLAGPVRVALVGITALGVLLTGLYDQTAGYLIPDYDGMNARWHSDEEYFTRVENVLGDDAAVFQLPIVRFPESPPVNGMVDYEHLRGYLHSDLRWSYGGVKYQQSEWQQVALQDGIGDGLPRLIAAGFDAVYVNRAAYTDGGALIESEIVDEIGPQTPVTNAEGTLAVYDLRAYRDALEASGEVLPSRAEVLFASRLAYGDGVYGEESTDGGTLRWATATAELRVLNPAVSEVSLVLSGVVRVATADASVTVTVGTKRWEFDAVNGEVHLDIPFLALPGETPVTITTDSAPTTAPGETRDLRQQLVDLRLERLP